MTDRPDPKPDAKPARTTDSGAFADWLADAALRALIRSLMRLPYDKRIARMGAIMRRGVGPLTGYRGRALRNLAMIYPDMSPDRRRAIADGVLDNFGRTIIENYSADEFGQRLQSAPITGTGLAAVEQAQRDKRPVIFVTGHFGNHEAPRQALTARGYTIGGLYRPMKNQRVNDHYAKTMTELSGPVFEQGRRGTIGFTRFLKDGGMGTLLFDVRVARGIRLPFLGHDAWTATSVADMALKFDAVVVPYFGIRQADGLSFEIAVEAPIPHSDPVTMTLAMNARLEQRIADHPEQWFWVHRRWKP
jgi:KDO2-lipid IV(A) lauroyltransferase